MKYKNELSTWPGDKQVIYLFAVKFSLLIAKELKLSSTRVRILPFITVEV